MCKRKKKEQKDNKPKISNRTSNLLNMVNNIPETEISEATREYIKNRLIEQRDWYAKSSRRAKKQYQRWMLVSLILSALIPVLALVADLSLCIQLVIAALSSSISFINAYLLLQNSKGQWISYRSTSEKLGQILHLYLTKAGPFSDPTLDDSVNDDPVKRRDHRLVMICEDIMTEEGRDWFETMDKL